MMVAWMNFHSSNEVAQCITSGNFCDDTTWDVRGGRSTDKSHRFALLKALPTLFVDPGEPMQTDRLDIIDELIYFSFLTERPPLELSAAAEPGETSTAINPNLYQALTSPISSSQFDLKGEVSVHPEQLIYELPPSLSTSSASRPSLLARCRDRSQATGQAARRQRGQRRF